MADDTAAHKKYVDDTLIPILQKLLQDSDPEVAIASLQAVTNVSQSGAQDTQSIGIPSCAHLDSFWSRVGWSVVGGIGRECTGDGEGRYIDDWYHFLIHALVYLT